MSEQPAQVNGGKEAKWRAIALLIAAATVAYANHFQNAFHFDDSHTIENNAAIRSLGNLWAFYRDASTFSTLPSNQSYRPLVSTLLALDYCIGGGLKPFVFHLSVFALFAGLILLLAVFIRRLLPNDQSSTVKGWITIVAVACYALHPANADTINYIIAVSDVISTLGVVGSFAAYLAFPRLRRYYLYVLPAAVTILAKPPAAVFAPLFAIFLLLFPAETAAGDGGWRRVIAWLTQVVPTFAICGAAVWFVQHMTPHTWVAGAANARNYLITQPYVIYLYFLTFFWPANLSADYDLVALTTTDDGRFWAGFAFLFLLVAVSILLCSFRRTRVIGFGLLWFLIALLPTSLFPLAEPMNDHRTFFPYVGLTIALAGVGSLLFEYKGVGRMAGRIAAIALVVVALPTSAYATWKRNEVWKTEESLWHDVTVKSPGNSRGLMNYGVTLMEKGDYDGARDYFYRAKALSPNYSILLINLAIAEDAATHSSQAEQYFREALQLAPSTPDSYTYYARWLAAQGRLVDAVLLVKKGLALSPTDLTAKEVLTKTETQLAHSAQGPELYVTLSLQYYNEGRYEDAIEACRSALALRPDYAAAWNNIGAAQNQLGRYAEGATACEKALRLDPGLELARNNLQFARAKLSQASVARPP